MWLVCSDACTSDQYRLDREPPFALKVWGHRVVPPRVVGPAWLTIAEHDEEVEIRLVAGATGSNTANDRRRAGSRADQPRQALSKRIELHLERLLIVIENGVPTMHVATITPEWAERQLAPCSVSSPTCPSGPQMRDGSPPDRPSGTSSATPHAGTVVRLPRSGFVQPHHIGRSRARPSALLS